MSREGTSHPVYDDQANAHDYVSKATQFRLQRAMYDANAILDERIQNLAIEMREAKARNKDYFNAKMDAQMENIQIMFNNHKS